MPVDFEVVNVDSSMTSEDDINDAIMAIRRNGVALKGQFVSECVCEICSHKGLENLENLGNVHVSQKITMMSHKFLCYEVLYCVLLCIVLY